MSWLFSQALVAEYSEANSLDGEPSAPSSGTPTPQAFLWRDKTTDSWSRFPSGMVYNHQEKPNAEWHFYWQDEYADLVSIKEIKKDEEIFTSYGPSYFKNRKYISAEGKSDGK